VGPTGSDGVPLDYDRFRDKIQITLLCDLGTPLDKGTVCLVFNPDNTRAGELPNLLEDVQALCFHAAWNKLPVILVNPVLLATAWCVVVPCVCACCMRLHPHTLSHPVLILVPGPGTTTARAPHCCWATLRRRTSSATTTSCCRGGTTGAAWCSARPRASTFSCWYDLCHVRSLTSRDCP